MEKLREMYEREKARADAAEAKVRILADHVAKWSDKSDELGTALAAARRECEEAFENGRTAGLEEAARDHLDGVLTPEDEHLNFRRREFRRHAYQRFYERGRRDGVGDAAQVVEEYGAPIVNVASVAKRVRALAAPAAGEEGKT